MSADPRAESILKASEARYRRLFESAKDGILILDADTGQIVDVNPFLTELIGYSHEEILNKHLWEIGLFKDIAASKASFEELQTKEYIRYEDLPLETRDGRKIDVEFVSNVYLVDNRSVIQCNIRDITDRVVLEKRARLAALVMTTLNRTHDISKLIEDILQQIKESTQMEAVGIRLREGDDYPYIETNGFPEHFVEMERHLCAQDADGELLRDENGSPVLECMCGNVLCERTDPSLPFFTESGSFWTNNAINLLASSTEAERQARTPNRCNGEGYESVALIPLRSGDEIIGLLQFNDHQPGRFTLEMIQFYERLGASIGIAIRRKQTEEALKTSEVQYRSLFEGASEGILVTDVETMRFTHANPAVCRMFGYTEEEFLQLGVANIHPEESLGHVMAEFEAQARGEKELAPELPCLRKGGAIFYADLVASSAMIGSQRCNVGFFSDVTERMELDAHIRHLNAMLRSIRNVNQTITHEKDRGQLLQKSCDLLMESHNFTGVWMASSGGIGTSFITAESGFGEDFALLHHDLDQGEMPPCGRRALRQKSEIGLVPAALCTDCPLAERRHGQNIMAAPLRHGDKEYGVMVIAAQDYIMMDEEEQGLLAEVAGDIAFAFHDIELDETHREAQEAITMLARFPNEAPFPVLRISEDGTVLYGNAASVPLLENWRCSEGQKLPQEWKDRIQDALHTRDTRSLEIKCDERMYLLRLVPIANSRYVNIYGVDITEQRETERNLRQSEKMQAVGLLAGGVAHEFNNQLAVINGFSELLLRKDLVKTSELITNNLMQILKAGQRAGELTASLLAYSRADEIEAKVVNLNWVLENIQDLLQTTIGEDVEIKFDLGPDLWIVKVDPRQMSDVIINLAANARDAMPAGGRLAIETSNVSLTKEDFFREGDLPPGGYIRLAVRDNGMGMDEQTKNHIFEPFFTTKPAGKGTGLGLSMVYGVIKKAGGYILIDSEVGKGTTLSIYLPCVDAEDDVEESDSSSAMEEIPGGHETILIVEDEEGIRDFVAMALTEVGYEVFTADSALNGLKCMEEKGQSVALVITDVVMPGMHGFDFLKELRKQFPGIKAVYMSGYSKELVEQRGGPASDLRILRKPISLLDLTQTVRAVLDDKEPPEGC